MHDESRGLDDTAVTDLRLSSSAVAAVVAADNVSLVRIVQELKQELESHRLAMMILVARVERLEAGAERRLIG